MFTALFIEHYSTKSHMTFSTLDWACRMHFTQGLTLTSPEGHKALLLQVEKTFIMLIAEHCWYNMLSTYHGRLSDT